MFSWPPAFFSSKPRSATGTAPRPASRTEALEVSHEGQRFVVRLRRNAAARRLILRLRADSGEAVLTLPARTSLKDARAFLDRYGGWIAERKARLPARVPLEDGAVLPLRGAPCQLRSLGGSGRGRITLEEGILSVPGEAAHLPRRALDWLKAEAKADLTAAVARHAATLGVRVGRITVKDTRSRWGSCSAAGALAFSWRLILAPPHVLDYLAAHEVAHRLEMNHSDRFWRVVARTCPEWQAAEAWLTAHGTGLHRYGPKGGQPAGC
ncbi:MAG: M48 family metallopeptidase [Proteobacteria bacterium]|nr:M48 family metallopeptidase [Pseudomonadota bacterium]